jgi:hypothetical membrane protein
VPQEEAKVGWFSKGRKLSNNSQIMFFLFIWLIFGIVGAMIGKQKGEGFLGFIIGMLLGPIGILAVLFSSGNRKVCPACKEHIHRDATRCPHCREELKERAVDN